MRASFASTARVAALTAADAKAMTFRQCAEGFMRDNSAGWTNPVHRMQWETTLAKHVYPVFRSLPVSIIDTPLVLRALKPLWERTPETASRVRGRIENILGWATVHHYRAGDNPARWNGLLEHALPARAKLGKVEHHSALPYVEIASFMAKLRREASAAARCLEFIVLTAARSGEAVHASWDEVDLGNRLWLVPAARMKAGREQRIPLTDPAIAALKAMQAIRHSDYIFPRARSGGPIAKNAMLAVAKRAAGRSVTVHGFRSTFRDWAAERTSFPREVAEMALAHAIPSAVEAAYRRGDLFEKRRKLMDAWAEFCAKPSASGTVVPIGVAMN
jgi:integrase